MGNSSPKGKARERYRYALNDNSTVGRVDFGAKKANTAEFLKNSAVRL